MLFHIYTQFMLFRFLAWFYMFSLRKQWKYISFVLKYSDSEVECLVTSLLLFLATVEADVFIHLDSYDFFYQYYLTFHNRVKLTRANIFCENV